MARYIICNDCNIKMAKLAAKYDELYEAIEGKSKRDFFCDGCYPLNCISEGELCFAAVVLPDKDHFNYKFQKPEVWMDDFIIPVAKTMV